MSHVPGPSYRTLRRILTLAWMLAAVAMLSTAGCSRRGPSAPVVLETAPVLDSPTNVLLALKWALEHRDVAVLRTLFSGEFVFVFSQHDSAGNAFRDRPWTRPDELISGRNLCEGGSGTEAPADAITLDFTNSLNEFPSSYPGHDPRVHREIRAEVILRIQRGASTLECRGPALFFFVRGDSATLTQEMLDEGFRPDSTRWWIQRWEDETVSSAGALPGTLSRRQAATDPNPKSGTSWGSIKALYR